jgi:hypothetical protein
MRYLPRLLADEMAVVYLFFGEDLPTVAHVRMYAAFFLELFQKAIDCRYPYLCVPSSNAFVQLLRRKEMVYLFELPVYDALLLRPPRRFHVNPY